MRRREFLQKAATAVLVALPGSRTVAQESGTENWDERFARFTAEARSAFPYEILRVASATALEEWERLKSAGGGSPVIVGGEAELDLLVEPFHPRIVQKAGTPSVADILGKAAALTHPDALISYNEAEDKRAEELLASDPQYRKAFEAILEQIRKSGLDVRIGAQPPLGEWPTVPPEPAGLTVLRKPGAGAYETVHIVLLPTDDWTTIPAYLRWGGWNANPPAEYHVAALRSWRDRYGAELIGLTHDTMNVRVAKRPSSREEALQLAREQYDYCNDVIVQGVGTLSNLAALLVASDWWFFWWD